MQKNVLKTVAILLFILRTQFISQLAINLLSKKIYIGT